MKVNLIDLSRNDRNQNLTLLTLFGNSLRNGIRLIRLDVWAVFFATKVNKVFYTL